MYADNMIVYVQGSFDVFHKGHKRLLDRAGKLGKVIVGVINDVAYKRNRGEEPHDDILKRIGNVSGNKNVDVVFGTDNLQTKEDIEAFGVDIIMVGTDWAKKDIYKQYDLTQKWLDKRGVELFYVPYTEGISSTQIKKKL